MKLHCVDDSSLTCSCQASQDQPGRSGVVSFHLRSSTNTNMPLALSVKGQQTEPVCVHFEFQLIWFHTWGPSGTMPLGGVIRCIGPPIFGCPVSQKNSKTVIGLISFFQIRVFMVQEQFGSVVF